jgi:hypothetical protein
MSTTTLPRKSNSNELRVSDSGPSRAFTELVIRGMPPHCWLAAASASKLMPVICPILRNRVHPAEGQSLHPHDLPITASITGPVDGDDHQRLELRRQCLHGRFETQLAHLAEQPRGGKSSRAAAGVSSPVRKEAVSPQPRVATLMVAPAAGISTKHSMDGKPLRVVVDFGLYFFHTAKRLIANRNGPYFYIPKMEFPEAL